MFKLSSLTTAAALLSTLALPALAATPQHGAVKHPIHRVAATTVETTAKPASLAVTAPVTTTAKPGVTAPITATVPPAAKPAAAKVN